MLPAPSYHMRDQIHDRVSVIMGERWLPSPGTALWALVAVVSVVSIFGAVDTIQALETLAPR